MSGDPTPSAPRREDLLVHGRFLRGLARALVSDSEGAEDLLQDTWTRALASPPRHGAAPRAWLARVLRRLAIERGRREGERGPRERLAAAESARESARPEDLAGEIELSRRVLDTVGRLREPYRETLYLRYYRDLAPQAIARDLGVPVKTVKTRLARGLELVREDLDRQHGGRREAWVAWLLPLARSGTGAPAPLPGPATPVLATALAAGAVLAGLAALTLTLGSGEDRASREAPGGPSVGALAPEPEGSAPLPADGRRPLRAETAPLPVAPSGVRLRGRVQDLAGEPIPAALVRAVWLGGDRGDSPRRPRGEESEPLELARVRTGVEGEFELTLARGGLVRLAVDHEDHAPLGRRSLVFEGQDLDVGVLVLDPGVRLAGRVQATNGVPVSGAEVWQRRLDEGLTLGPALAHWELAARTDDGGRFAIAAQASGGYRLEARAPSFAPARTQGTTGRPGEAREDLLLELEPGASLRGEVLGLENAGPGRVAVLARDPEGEVEELGRLASLDREGSFALEGLVPGSVLELVPVQEDRGGRRPLSEPLRVTVGAAEEPVVLRIERVRPRATRSSRDADTPVVAGETGEVALQVLRDGVPVAGALVARRAQGTRTGPPGEVRASDREGRLEWTGLEAGLHEFHVIDGVPGLERDGEESWRAVEVGPGERAELVLTSRPTIAVAGTVRVDGQALSQAELVLRRAPEPDGERAAFEGRRGGPSALLARSDAEGSFSFQGLTAGRYELELAHPSRALPELRTLELRAPREVLSLELSDAVARGVVLGPAGPVEGARVRALPDEEHGRRNARPERGATTDGLGGFVLRGLEPGRPVRLEVEAAGLATRVASFEGPESVGQIALEAEAVLVIDLAGEHEGLAPLRARGPGGLVRFAVVPLEGTLRLNGLAPGTWRLEVLEGGRGGREPGLRAEREVELGVGETRLRWSLP